MDGVLTTRCGRIPGIRSPGRPNYGRWRLIWWVLDMELASCHPFWHHEFCGDSQICGNSCIRVINRYSWGQLCCSAGPKIVVVSVQPSWTGALSAVSRRPEGAGGLCSGSWGGEGMKLTTQFSVEVQYDWRHTSILHTSPWRGAQAHGKI